MNIQHLPLIILIGALLFDLLLGELPNIAHPVVWMGSYIKFFWKKRISHSHRGLFLSGIIILISGICLFSIIPYMIIKIIPFFLSIILSVLMLTTVFSIKALIKAGLEVRDALEDEDLEKARTLTAWHLVSRDMSVLTKDEVVSSVIESLAENITDGFTSPILFFSLGGLPAAWAYRFTNTSDSLIAYRTGDNEWGGKATAWLDSILNWVPSRLTAFLICLSALLLGEDWKNSWRTMRNQHKRTSSPNAGWTMAAMAGALNIKLEKKGEYLLDGGIGKREYQLINRAIKIVITTMIFIIILSILLLEVIN